MLRFVLRRLASGVVLTVATSVVTFFLLYAAGGNIARRILGPQATTVGIRAKQHELGLDRPILAQFGHWVSHALRGDFGSSWFDNLPVTQVIGDRLPVTLSLVVGATLVTAVVSVLLGVLAARRGGWIDRLVQFVSMLGFAVPSFLVAIALVLVFAIKLGLVAPTGYTRFTDSPSGWLSSIVLPVIALSIGSVSGVAQQIRGSLLDAQRQDWVRVLRSHGLPESRVLYLHVLRNAAGPALSVLGLQFVSLIGGAVIVEQIFAVAGLGQAAVSATSQGDVPVVMGLVIVVGAIVVVLNLLVDLLLGWLNPKVRRA
ncbi:ABC transporter permease [Streptomyces sp. NPDC090075]|uniref:ABC transporter permease n=1 Tax=unclassified Streptomyces TaxID=2593676 RepID=UPI0037FA5704